VNSVGSAARRSWGGTATLGWSGLALLPWALALFAYWRRSEPISDWVKVLAQLFSLVVVVAAARLAGWQAREYLALSRPNMRDVALGVGAMIALSLTVSVVLFATAGPSVIAQSGTDSPLVGTAYFAAVALFWVAAVVVDPICEEVFWRGFVYRGLASSALGPSGAIIVISAIFALLHLYGLFGTVFVFLNGILYGWLRWHTGSLTAPIAAHMFHNGTAAAIATFGN
jgi:uncharacterized protein